MVRSSAIIKDRPFPGGGRTGQRFLLKRNREAFACKTISNAVLYAVSKTSPEISNHLASILGAGNIPKEVKQATRFFIINPEKTAGTMAQELKLINEQYLKKNGKNITAKEREIHEALPEILEAISRGEDVKQKVAKVLDNYKCFTCGNKNLKDHNELAVSLKNIIEYPDKDNIESALYKANDILRKKDSQNWPLLVLSSSSILFSTFYVVYRASMILVGGYHALDYLGGTLLLAAEFFFNGLSIIYNTGVVRSLLKTKGAHGQSHLPKLRTSLSENPYERPKAAVLMPSSGSPPLEFATNVKYALRSIWRYGNGTVFNVNGSKTIFHYFGFKGAVRGAKQMAARKVIVEEYCKRSGITDPALANKISSSLAAEKTELDNPEMETIEKIVANTAREYNIYERKVKLLGKIIRNHYLNGDEISFGLIFGNALKLKIDHLKALALSEECFNKISSLIRLQGIARLGDKCLKSKDFSSADASHLIDLLMTEFNITEETAGSLINSIRIDQKSIELKTKEINSEFDFFSTPEKRKIYYKLYSQMEEMMHEAQKGAGSPNANMAERFRKIAEWELFEKWEFISGERGKWIADAFRLNSSKFKLTESIGLDIAKGISKLKWFSIIERALQKNAALTFNEAEEIAWQERKQQIINLMNEIGKKYHLEKEQINDLTDAVTNNLQRNSQERKLSAYELIQYLASEVAKDKKAEDILSKFPVENVSKGKENKLKGSKFEEELILIIEVMRKEGLLAFKSGAPENEIKKLRARVDDYVNFAYLPGNATSAKALAINMAIHGRSIDQQIGELGRQIIYKTIKERFFNEIYISNEIASDIDKTFLDFVPQSVKVKPDEIARNIAIELSKGKSRESVVADLISVLKIPDKDKEKTTEEITRIAAEIEARLSFSASENISPETAVRWKINPNGRTGKEIAEEMIAIRHLPEKTIKDEPVAPIVEKIAEIIDKVIEENREQINDLISKGKTSNQIAEEIIRIAAGKMDGLEKNYLNEKRPPASALKYDVIGVWDSDYQLSEEAFEEVVPYFVDHPCYYFFGKRQSGRNLSSNVAKTMESGGSAYWGYTNIENSLIDAVASWGSNVFHSSRAYMDQSFWVLYKDEKGKKNELGISSQDPSSESEDISSSINMMRTVPYITGGKHVLERSGFIEGYGSKGMQPDAPSTLENTMYERWDRGNVALAPKIWETPMGPYRKARTLSLSFFWLYAIFRPILLFSPLIFEFLGVDSMMIKPMLTESSAELPIAVAIAFTLPITTFYASMRARGYSLADSFRSILFGYNSILKPFKSSMDGLRGKRPSFAATAKDMIVPEKKSLKELKLEIGLATANTMGAAYSTGFMLSRDSNLGMLGVLPWNVLHALLITTSVLYLNKGVMKDPPKFEKRNPEIANLKFLSEESNC